jgi:hypothetical protein
MASKCADCAWRKRSEENPKSFMARIWRWHTKVCPSWKAYQRELARQEQEQDDSPE